MTETPGSPAAGQPPRQRRFGIRSALWIAFWICCLLAGWLKASQNRKAHQRYRADRVARQQRAADLYPLGEKAQQRVANLFRNGLDGVKPVSRRRLEQELNQGRPFSLQWDEKRGRHQTTWVDPKSGRVFRLSFRDGQWTGYNTHWGSDANLPPVPPPRAIYGDDREQVRKLVVGYGPFFWLLSLGLLAALGGLRAVLCLRGMDPYAEGLQPHCQFLADALVALAILCTLAWLVNPRYSITFAGVTSNDNLALGTMMLAISIPILAGVSPASPRDETEDRGPWQYSLRALLLVMTLCAVMFALAPFGYVVAMFAAGGWAGYALARALMGRQRLRRRGP